LGNFFSWPHLLARPNSKFAPLEKSKTGKLFLFSDSHKRLSGPRALVCLISLVSSPSCYPVATVSALIRRTMLPNNRRVRWLSASSSQ
jgi:hypothetical protein